MHVVKKEKNDKNRRKSVDARNTLRLWLSTVTKGYKSTAALVPLAAKHKKWTRVFVYARQ